jgi:hypothetical protein
MREANRSRHFSVGHPIDRGRFALAQLDFSRARCRDRGPDTAVRCGLPGIYRNACAGQIRNRLDPGASHDNRDQMVGIVWRRSCGLFGVDILRLPFRRRDRRAAALKFATLAVGSAAILDAASYAFGD